MRHHEDISHKPRYCILLEFCKLLYVMFIYTHTARQRFLKKFSFLQMPCDEGWKREELKRYLLRSPILQWEGSPIQHMGQPAYLSLVHISNTQRQVSKRCQGNTHHPFSKFNYVYLYQNVGLPFAGISGTPLCALSSGPAYPVCWQSAALDQVWGEKPTDVVQFKHFLL